MHTSIEDLYLKFLNHREISTDSRQISPGCLFFALKGDNFDGNQYAQKAVAAGAAFAIIDNPAFESTGTLLVDDVLTALQQLALMRRRKFNIPVLAITGSNGKTTTKELVNAVLTSQFRVVATKGNLNNHIGVPITLLGITNETQIAIIEMGANHQGEIAELCKIAEPTLGLITNIGRAHLGGFGGYEGVIKAKSELYKWVRNSEGVVFVNAGNPLLMELTAGMDRQLYGSTEGVNSFGKIRENLSTLALDWILEKETVEIKTNLVGNYNFENVMAAICIGSYFNVAPAKIQSAISSCMPSNSRSQALVTARNSIILDAYNANPTSMQVAIENFRQLKAQHKMVVLGDMLELGDESQIEHRAIVNLIEESDFETVILVGPEFTSASQGKFLCFPDSEKAHEWLVSQKFSNFSILIKGSRGIKMEKVLDAL